MVTTISRLSPSQRTPVLDYPTIGGLAAKWMEANLVYGPGDLYNAPFRVDEYFREFLDDLYRVHPVTGKRIVRRAVLSVGKGGAKTEFQAAVDLFELAGPAVVDPVTGSATIRRSPEIPCAASSRFQAGKLWSAAQAMCRPIADTLDVFDYEIARKDGSGKMERVAAVTGANDGGRPSSVSIDELHEWTGNKERVYLILTNGLTKRADSFELTVSTAGDPGKSHQLFNLYDYGKRVASGEVVDESFLMHWYEADPDTDLTVHSELLRAIEQANPGSWIDPEQIAKRFEVDKIPEHEFRRYNLNQWVSGGSTWLPAGEWDGCKASVSVPDGSRVVLGFDGSHNADSTALLGCTLDTETPHIFEVGAWEKPSEVDGWRVDREAVDAAVDDAFRRFDVVELACDPAKWSLYLDMWAERYGDDRVLEYSQKRQMMVPATSKLYDAVTNRLVTHDGSEVLRRHIGNATVKPIPGGRYVIQKGHPDHKIDAAIAAVMVFDRATWRREQPQEVRAELW